MTMPTYRCQTSYGISYTSTILHLPQNLSEMCGKESEVVTEHRFERGEISTPEILHNLLKAELWENKLHEVMRLSVRSMADW